MNINVNMHANRIRKVFNWNYLHKFRSAQNLAKSESEIEVLPKQSVQTAESNAGIVVASLENYSPLSSITIAVKAGSRYENGHNMGIVHCLRNCATLSTENHSAFSVTRNLEIKGAKLGVLSTREYLIYTLQCIRDDVDCGLQFLTEVATQPAFKPWEVKDSVGRMHVDLALHKTNPEAVLMEMTHKAAFRGGLSNSLYSVPFMVGKHSTEMLRNFMAENFTTSRTSVVGIGIGHDHLQDAVNKLLNVNNPSSGNAGASKYAGGEIRKEADIPFVHAAIVTEGSGSLNMKDKLSLGVLQCLLGTGSHIKLRNSSYSKIGEAAAKCTKNPYAVSSININYSDSGLFGVYIAGLPDDMKQLVKSVVSQMRNVTKNITESEVKIAKHKLKAKLHLERESSKDLIFAMATDVLQFKQVQDMKTIEKAIDDLQTSDITTIASKVMKTKPAMAALGRLHSTPHLDELI